MSFIPIFFDLFLQQAVPKHINELNLTLNQGENYVVSVVAVMTDQTTWQIGNIDIES